MVYLLPLCSSVSLQVPIRIHKFFDPELYRWPVLLELTEEDTAALIMSPDDFEPPANIHWAQEQGMTPEEVREGRLGGKCLTRLYFCSEGGKGVREEWGG